MTVPCITYGARRNNRCGIDMSGIDQLAIP